MKQIHTEKLSTLKNWDISFVKVSANLSVQICWNNLLCWNKICIRKNGRTKTMVLTSKWNVSWRTIQNYFIVIQLIQKGFKHMTDNKELQLKTNFYFPILTITGFFMPQTISWLEEARLTMLTFIPFVIRMNSFMNG